MIVYMPARHYDRSNVDCAKDCGRPQLALVQDWRTCPEPQGLSEMCNPDVVQSYELLRSLTHRIHKIACSTEKRNLPILGIEDCPRTSVDILFFACLRIYRLCI